MKHLIFIEIQKPALIDESNLQFNSLMEFKFKLKITRLVFDTPRMAYTFTWQIFPPPIKKTPNY